MRKVRFSFPVSRFPFGLFVIFFLQKCVQKSVFPLERIVIDFVIALGQTH
jgi:hypothetical protein